MARSRVCCETWSRSFALRMISRPGETWPEESTVAQFQHPSRESKLAAPGAIVCRLGAPPRPKSWGRSSQTGVCRSCLLWVIAPRGSYASNYSHFINLPAYMFLSRISNHSTWCYKCGVEGEIKRWLLRRHHHPRVTIKSRNDISIRDMQ